MPKKHLSKKRKNRLTKRRKRTKRRGRKFRGGAVANNNSCVRTCVESCSKPSIFTRFKSFISPKPETNVFQEQAPAPPRPPPPPPAPKLDDQELLNNNNLNEDNDDLNKQVTDILGKQKPPGLWGQIKDFFKPNKN